MSLIGVLTVSTLDTIIKELKSLPPPKLQQVAGFIQRLKPISQEERQTILARTAGCLSPEEADELERVIEEGCERIDEHGW